MRWAGYVVYMEKVRNAYKMLGKHKGKRSLGRRCNRWDDDNFKRVLEKNDLEMWTGFIWLRIWIARGYN
jgi:hypothetical protein